MSAAVIKSLSGKITALVESPELRVGRVLPSLECSGDRGLHVHNSAIFLQTLSVRREKEQTTLRTTPKTAQRRRWARPFWPKRSKRLRVRRHWPVGSSSGNRLQRAESISVDGLKRSARRNATLYSKQRSSETTTYFLDPSAVQETRKCRVLSCKQAAGHRKAGGLQAASWERQPSSYRSTRGSRHASRTLALRSSAAARNPLG